MRTWKVTYCIFKSNDGGQTFESFRATRYVTAVSGEIAKMSVGANLCSSPHKWLILGCEEFVVKQQPEPEEI